MLGKLYLTSGNLPSAEKELGRARTLGLNSAELVAALGELWLKQGRREQLLRELQPQDGWPQDAKIAVHRPARPGGGGHARFRRGAARLRGHAADRARQRGCAHRSGAHRHADRGRRVLASSC